MKSYLCCIIAATFFVFMLAKAGATGTNASWVFPASTSPGPSQPIAADLSGYYSTNDVLGWIAAGSHLNESFVSNPGNTTALEFSYNGNHADSLNGSTLTLSSTIAGLPTGDSLTNIQLSYQTRWNQSANNLTQTWAYSLDGGALVDFYTNSVAGNSTWQDAGSILAGLQLHDGDTLTISDTFSGAAGNNGNLDFDNIYITSTLSIPVPEPSTLTLVALGVGFAGLRFGRWKPCRKF